METKNYNYFLFRKINIGRLSHQMQIAPLKHISHFLFLVFYFILPNNGYGSESDTIPPTPQHSAKTVWIIGDAYFPPYEFINEQGNPDGFNINLMCAIMEELNIPYQIKLDTWNSTMNQLYDSDSCEFFMNMIYSPERAKIFHFGATNCQLNPIIVSREEYTPGSNLNDLKEKKIIVENGDITHEIVKKAGFESIIPVDNISDGLRLLSQEKNDAAFLCDKEVAQSLIFFHGLSNLIITDLDIPPFEYRFASSNDSLLTQINGAFLKLKENGTYDKIYNKWLNRPAKSNLSNFIYAIIGLLIFIAGFLYALNSYLRQQIKKANKELLLKNEKLALAILAGKIEVWGYDVANDWLFNIEGKTFPPEGVSGATGLASVHPDDLEEFSQIFFNTIKGILPEKTVCIRFKNEETQQWEYIEKEFALIYSDNNKVKTVIGTHKNVTPMVEEKMNTEVLFRKYQSIFNSNLVGLAYYDSNCILKDINDAYCKILGITNKQAIIDARVSFYDSPMTQSAIQQGSTISTFQGVIEYDFDKLKSKKQFSSIFKTGICNLELHINPIYNSENNLECIIVGATDVTESQKLHQLLYDNVRKTEYAIKTSNMVFWEFNRNTQLFKCYNEPINNYDENQLLTFDDYFCRTHANDLEALKAEAQNMLEGIDQSFTVDVRIKIIPDSGWQFCTITGTPFKDQTGKVIKYVGFRRDNTEIVSLNNEVHEYAERIKYILKSSEIWGWEYRMETQKISVFSADEELFDKMTLEQYLQQVDESDREISRQQLERMKRGELEAFQTKKDLDPSVMKHIRHAIINGIPIKDEVGQTVGYSGIIRDITDLIQAQISLNQEKEKAQQADKLKSAFLANMSHEIRTPLNAIIGFSELISETENPKDREEYIQIIKANNNQLLNLINDILDLSKIESGVMVLQREYFDMSSLFNDFYYSMKQRINNPEIEFTLDNPYKKCMVYLDRSRVTQVLTNFTTNAIKYTPKGSIKLSYEYVDNGIRISVKDSGIGIPKEKHHRIFCRFEKLDDFAQGTGLGLSICKAIIDAANGKVGFTSEVGIGSTFWAWAPCNPALEE